MQGGGAAVQNIQVSAVRLMGGRVGTFLGNPLVLQINYLGSSMILPFLLDVSECLNQATGEVAAGGGFWPPP